MKVYCVYFSATYTTKKIVEEIASSFSADYQIVDITNVEAPQDFTLAPTDLLIAGIPVYAGRVPALATERLAAFKGTSTVVNGIEVRTPAISVAVYGNRDYEDALLELSDTLMAQNFQVIAAGAFIGRHCIFPKVASLRPDANDLQIAREFAQKAQTLLGGSTAEAANLWLPSLAALAPIKMRGNHPYRQPGHPPMVPHPTDACTDCGRCAALCPVGAIDPKDVSIVDEELCLRCGRCQVVCPVQCRSFSGEAYEQMAAGFEARNSARKEPELFYAQKV